jgi:hypothetical protein
MSRAKLGLEATPDVLRLGSSVERVLLRLVELPFEVGDVIVLGDFRRAVRGLLAQLVGLLVELVFVLRSHGHAINLVSAFAVKSTMGTTRA